MTIDTTGTAILPSVDGILRVYVPASFGDDARNVARSAACKDWGNVGVGMTPSGVKATKPGKGWTFDFSPVTVKGRPPVRGSKVAAASATVTAISTPVTPPPATDADTTDDEYRAMSKRELVKIIRALESELVNAAFASIESPGKAKPAKRSAPKCVTCDDIGLVRGTGQHAYGTAPDPLPGKRAAWLYRTPNGAAQALEGGRAKKCPACKGKGARQVKAS